jgi:tRNA(adenine34) deaminase
VDHETFMAAALEQARLGLSAGEVPIGAVLVLNGEIAGAGFNQPISSGDPTAHAEIVAIRQAAAHAGNYRLTGATIYVTVEPCLMCVGALVHARIGTLVFGAAEPRTGAVVSTVRGGDLPGHNHRFDVVAGVREAECRELMQAFFREKRACSRCRIPALFLPQRQHRIDPAGALGRDQSGRGRDQRQQDHGPRRGKRVVCLNAIELRGDVASEAKGRGNTDREPDREQQQHLAHHHPDDNPRLGAEREPDAELLLALRDDERHHAVESD